MFEYYFEKYRQGFYYSIIGILLLLGGIYGYYMYLSGKYSEISYFQIEVYPEVFSISCSIETECETLKLHDFKSQQVVSYASEKFDSVHRNKEFIQNLIQSITAEEYLGRATSNLVFEKVQDRGMTTRKVRGEKLSQLESQCLSGIESSIVLGSHEREETIQKRFIQECHSMTGDTTPDLSVVEMAQRSTMSSVKFEMNSVRVRYSFFTRKKDGMLEEQNEYEIFPINFTFSLDGKQK